MVAASSSLAAACDAPSETDELPVRAQVLVVERSAEEREVLHTILETRGLSSVEVAGAREGLELLRLCRPSVIVLDLDAEAADDERVRDQWDCEAREQNASLVVLGRARRYSNSLPAEQVVAKPYHYAPLIRTIERLLGR